MKKTMKDITKRFWKWLHATDESTWVGHALQGFVVALVSDLVFASMNPAVYALTYHFGAREIEDLIYDKKKDDKTFIDGAFDFLSPFLGMVMYIIGKVILHANGNN